MSTPMKTIIPEIDEIVNFFTPELIEQTAKDFGFVQRILYSLRWQIELVFKSWKSYNGLSEVKDKRSERIECFIYGRLIMLTLMFFMSGGIRRHLWNTKNRESSFMKVIRHFQVKASNIDNQFIIIW